MPSVGSVRTSPGSTARRLGSERLCQVGPQVLDAPSLGGESGEPPTYWLLGECPLLITDLASFVGGLGHVV